ncbi:MAG: hypothetical protein ACRCTY_04230 [Candidatus Adiutrix sp.]
MVKKIHLAFLCIALIFASACTFKTRPQATAFNTPMESRLILGVPFLGYEENGGGPAALASVMTYNGRKTTAQDALGHLSTNIKAMGRDMVIWARREGLKADFYAGSPDDLLAQIKLHKPIIVRLDLPVAPISKNSFAVVVGFNAEGPVVNSGIVHQQILPWSDFLSAWFKADYFTILIEPL